MCMLIIAPVSLVSVGACMSTKLILVDIPRAIGALNLGMPGLTAFPTATTPLRSRLFLCQRHINVVVIIHDDQRHKKTESTPSRLLAATSHIAMRSVYEAMSQVTGHAHRPCTVAHSKRRSHMPASHVTIRLESDSIHPNKKIQPTCANQFENAHGIVLPCHAWLHHIVRASF
jgi:hypothetical protein